MSLSIFSKAAFLREISHFGVNAAEQGDVVFSSYVYYCFELYFTHCVSEFIPCMDKLFDESILIGSGYTARETLR